MSRVNLKLKFLKGNYLKGSYNVSRLQDENLREIFEEQLNTKLDSLKFDDVEDGWNNENVLNRDEIAGKNMEEKEKVCITLDVKEDVFCKEELALMLKGLKNNKTLDADSVVNEFLKYGGSEVRNRLLKIMNMIFEKGVVSSDFGKTLIKPL